MEKPSAIMSNHHFPDIVGQNPFLQSMLRSVELVAATDTTVLLLGETGTGKELVARAIHRLSLRQQRPFIKVNCAALPGSLIESELFGHEKGAFTGALARKMGRFELAHGGTIFLDEIGDAPLGLQAKLLRVLQEGEFERLGSTRTIKADIRVIAATNRNLEQAMQEGSFRADLFYRLYVFPIRIPPLRERKPDIPLLVRHFTTIHNARLGKHIDIYYPFRVAYTWGAHRFALEGAYHRDRHSPRSPFCCGGVGDAASGTNDNDNPIQIRKQKQDAVLLMPNWTGSFGPISGILEALIMVGTATALTARTMTSFPMRSWEGSRQIWGLYAHSSGSCMARMTTTPPMMTWRVSTTSRRPLATSRCGLPGNSSMHFSRRSCSNGGLLHRRGRGYWAAAWGAIPLPTPGWIALG